MTNLCIFSLLVLVVQRDFNVRSFYVNVATSLIFRSVPLAFYIYLIRNKQINLHEVDAPFVIQYLLWSAHTATYV